MTGPFPIPIKVYQRTDPSPKGLPEGPDASLLVKFRVFLEDRPGSLAAFSKLISDMGGNISFFHYDRAFDSSCVAVEIQLEDRERLERLIKALPAGGCFPERPEKAKEEILITGLENILEIRVRLENRPGTLAAFAGLLAEHGANVTYMLYDENIDPESAVIALAASAPQEIDGLLEAINRKGYYYRLLYRGSDREEVEHIIGLKMVEKFYLRLRKLLADKDAEEVKALVDSSQDLHADLVRFYSEAGQDLEAADVFEKVLALASMSRSRVGERFSATAMPVIEFAGVKLYGFRLPTTENVYVFDHNGELTMIDSGYGIYYNDLKALMRRHSLDPASVGRIFVTHPDADHAGTSGYFAGEFGARVFMHPASRGVIDSNNRAHGSTGGLSGLNEYYTKLVNRFTECRFPDEMTWFGQGGDEKVGGFTVLDRFSVGDLRFLVLESWGGHIEGQVFFFERERGLFFSSDYLINLKSLSIEERDHLGVYKYLLISPNTNRAVFKEELEVLKGMLSASDGLVFPGHGDYYRAKDLLS